MEKKITGADYLYLALYAVAGIGLEMLLVGVIEPILGISLETYTTAQNIVHWIIICIVWLLVGIFLIGLAKKKYSFNIWEYHSKLKGRVSAAFTLAGGDKEAGRRPQVQRDMAGA